PPGLKAGDVIDRDTWDWHDEAVQGLKSKLAEAAVQAATVAAWEIELKSIDNEIGVMRDYLKEYGRESARGRGFEQEIGALLKRRRWLQAMIANGKYTPPVP